MSKYTFNSFIFFLTMLICLPVNLFSENIHIFAGKNAPFNFMYKGKVSGVSVNILQSIFKQANLSFNQKDIILDSWSSVFSQSIVTPNSLLITVSRIPEREDLFQWIGPVATVRLAMIARKNTISIKNLNNLKFYNIVSIKNTSAERAFVKAGGDLSSISRVSTPKQGYRMLEYGRIDALICTDLPFMYNILKRGKNIEDYEIIYILDRSQYYIAAHKNIPAQTINIINNEMTKLKQKNINNISQYDLIMAKYFKGTVLSEKNN